MRSADRANEVMKEAGVSVKSETAFGRDWTKGSIVRNLWSLSWPMMVSNSLNMLGPTIDMIWVGKLGAAAIAGVGVAGMAVMLVDSMRMGIVMGARAMIARSVGARDYREANHVAQQGFIVSTALAGFLAAIGIFFAEPIMSFFGVETDVVAQGAAYLRIMFVGSVTMSIRVIAEGVMQASGDAMTPMKIAGIFRLFHVALAPFLIFGWWVFPPLGVSGAALTNVISQSLGTVLALWFLLTGRSRLQLTFRNFRLVPDLIWRIVKIGIPASVMGIERTLGQLILLWFVVPFGTLPVAAHTLNQRIEMFLFMPTMGMGMAAGVLVGHNLGAREPERAERNGWLAAGLMQGFMVACSVAILLWAETIIHIFSSDPGLVAVAGSFLRIAVAGYLVMALAAVLQQCISGAGDTLLPMLVSLLTIWGVQVPLAFFLPRVTGLGVYGVRWGMVAGMVVGAVAFTAYFRAGRWKRKRV